MASIINRLTIVHLELSMNVIVHISFLIVTKIKVNHRRLMMIVELLSIVDLSSIIVFVLSSFLHAVYAFLAVITIELL